MQTFRNKVLSLYRIAAAPTLDEALKKTATPGWIADIIEEYDNDPRRAKALPLMLDDLLRRVKSNTEYKDGYLVVYRCLNATIEVFEKSKAVGSHWTFDPSNIRCWEQNTGNWITLVGRIAVKDVDYHETLWTNLSFEEETEVTLKAGKFAFVDKIIDYKTKKVLKTYRPALRKKN